MKKSFDLSVYFIADPSLCERYNIAGVVRLAIEGGATMIQFRDKQNPKNEVIENAIILRDICEEFGVTFLINDYVNIAREIGAGGVHIGQGDMTPIEARTLLGPDAIIGLTAFTEDHIAAIEPSVVDYIGTGPFYPTQTDKGKPVLGPEKFKALAAKSPVPVVGIGGITPENARAVMEAGADGVAMMRAISGAKDPKGAAQEFAAVVRAYKNR